MRRAALLLLLVSGCAEAVTSPGDVDLRPAADAGGEAAAPDGAAPDAPPPMCPQGANEGAVCTNGMGGFLHQGRYGCARWNDTQFGCTFVYSNGETFVVVKSCAECQ